MKRICSLLCAAALLAALPACGGTETPAQPTPPAASSQGTAALAPAEELTPQPQEPEGTNPLTGLALDPAYETLRPVAVMLNNLKAAQPQLGNSRADIIYEVPAEGGITRMLALYQTLDGVGTLGSIRSSRPYYIELALGHDALYIHAGGSPEAYTDLSAWDVDNMDGVNGGSDAAIFWRDKERRKTMDYEHTLVTSGEKIQEYAAEHFRTEHEDDYTYGQRFAADALPSGGTTAERVEVRFSDYKTGVFEYDADEGVYLVSQYGQAYTDGNTGEQVRAANLLTLQTEISVIPGDTYGRLRVQTTGEGSGAYFCGGKTVSIHWSRKDRNSPFVYTTEDGKPLTLREGTSYVCIYSAKTGSVSV